VERLLPQALIEQKEQAKQIAALFFYFFP
jgi:hypothetical protein